MENENSGKIEVKGVVALDIDLNEPGLGSKKKNGLLETKNHYKTSTLHPDVGILTKLIHIMGFNLQGIEELTGPDRQAFDAAQIRKETVIGTAMIYLRKNR